MNVEFKMLKIPTSLQFLLGKGPRLGAKVPKELAKKDTFYGLYEPGLIGNDGTFKPIGPSFISEDSMWIVHRHRDFHPEHISIDLSNLSTPIYIPNVPQEMIETGYIVYILDGKRLLFQGTNMIDAFLVTEDIETETWGNSQ